MRHGFKLAKLPGRDRGAKRQHLRNLVSALLHHELIVTTEARAEYTARMAEKMITKGKRGTAAQAIQAQSFVMKPHHHAPSSFGTQRTDPPHRPIGYPEISPTAMKGEQRPHSLMSKLFFTLAERYKHRTGGYTRILRYGKTRSNAAPMAIVCLVGGPRDVKFEMLARVVGKQAVVAQNKELLALQASEGARDMEAESSTSAKKAADQPKGQVLQGGLEDWKRHLTGKTQEELKNLLLLRSSFEIEEFERKAREYADEVLAQEHAMGGLRRLNPDLALRDYSEQRRSKNPWIGMAPKAGERLSGMDIGMSGLQIARGILKSGTVMGKYARKPLSPIIPQFVKKAGPVMVASAASR